MLYLVMEYVFLLVYQCWCNRFIYFPKMSLTLFQLWWLIMCCYWLIMVILSTWFSMV